MRKFVVLGFLVLALFASRVPIPTDNPQTTKLTSRVSRFIDAKAGVVCWTYYGYSEASISCLPISQTKLDIGESK